MTTKSFLSIAAIVVACCWFPLVVKSQDSLRIVFQQDYSPRWEDSIAIIAKKNPIVKEQPVSLGKKGVVEIPVPLSRISFEVAVGDKYTMTFFYPVGYLPFLKKINGGYFAIVFTENPDSLVVVEGNNFVHYPFERKIVCYSKFPLTTHTESDIQFLLWNKEKVMAFELIPK